ncbi:MAG TPA: ion channel [Rhodocyclaceae bacterium]
MKGDEAPVSEVRQRARARGLPARGEVVIRKTTRQRRLWSDPYHLILTLSWPRFFALLTGFFVALNLVFATAYRLVPGSVDHAASFLDDLFFSIETLATVGYGEMSPGNLPGHVLSSLEILSGLMSLAVVTGLVFARFSKPTSRVLFSNKAVVREFDGRRVLMLRLANERHNRMVEPSAHLGMVRLETTADGERYFRLHDLALARERNPVFALTWTLIHPIDASSPLAGWTREALEQAQTRIIVSILGHDETIAAAVHALHEYSAEDLFFDHRFVDIMADSTDGARIIDLTRFHDVVSCSAPGRAPRRQPERKRT